MKKWTYLAVAGMLLGSAPVFTGCVDTDEPWGVEQLRGAKAELLKAKAAVEQANAEYRQAEIQWLAAKTAQEEAIAKYREYEAEAQRIANEIQEARNEAEKAKLEAEKQYYQNLMEEQMVQHETAMINLQYLQAEAQRNYELLLKQIEIAEAIGSDDATVDIATLKTRVTRAYEMLYGMDGKGGIAKQLRDAQENLYNAQMDKLHGVDSSNPNNELWIPTLENNLAEKQADLVAAQEALADLQAFAEKPVEDTDWRAEIETLETEIEALEKEIDEIRLQIEEGKATPEYLEKLQAVEGVKDGQGNVVTPGTVQLLSAATAKLLDKQKQTELSIPDYEPKAEFTSEMETALGQNKAYFSYKNVAKYTWSGKSATQPNFVNQYPQAVKDQITWYENRLEVISERTIKDANEIAQAKALLVDKQNAEKSALEKYNTAKKEWQAVLDIISKAAPYSVPTTELEKTTKAYNDAYGKLETAVKNWNEGIQAVYDDAYDKQLDVEKLKVKGDALSNSAIWGTITASQFDRTQAASDWNDVKDETYGTESLFTQIVNSNCKGTGETLAANQKAVWAVINNQVAIKEADATWSGKTNAANEGLNAVQNEFDTDKALDKAITTAITATNTEYGKLQGAIDAFITLANDTYAQKLTDAAAELLKPNKLVAVANKDGEYIVDTKWATSSTENDDKITLYTVLNSKIEDEEIDKATETVYYSDRRETALTNISKKVFGVDEARYVEPSEEEIMTGNVEPKAPGYVYWDAVAEREEQEAIISCNDDLIAFEEEFSKALDDFKAMVEADYAEAFKDEQAAYDTAKANYLAAKAELDKANAQFSELNAKQAELDAQIRSKQVVVDSMKDLIWKYLGITWPAGSDGGNASQYEPDLFEDQLAQAIEAQKQEVATAEKDVAEAEVELKKAQDGLYDAVAYYTYVVNNLYQQFERSSAEYEKAQDDLELALEIMSNTTSEEQPAE